MALKSDQIASASPAVGAVGVEDSLNAAGEYDAYDVTISVTYSPKSGQVAQVANKQERMTAKEFAAFREKTNEWDGKKFLQEFFPAELKAAQDAKEEASAPQVYIVQGNPTPVPTTGQGPAQSSVDTTPAFSGEVVKAEVTKAPKTPKGTDFQPPAGGSDSAAEGNVETPAYKADTEPSNPSGLAIDKDGKTVEAKGKK